MVTRDPFIDFLISQGVPRRLIYQHPHDLTRAFEYLSYSINRIGIPAELEHKDRSKLINSVNNSIESIEKKIQTHGNSTTTTTTTLPREAIDEPIEKVKDLFEDAIQKTSDIPDLLRELINAVESLQTPNVRAFLIYVLIQFFAQIAFHILIPKIDTAIRSNPNLDKQGVTKAVERTIKDTELEKNLLSNFRLVTADILNVREKPTTKSKVVELLRRNNLVKVVEKRRNWILIEYKDESTEYFIRGWVSGRYLKRII